MVSKISTEITGISGGIGEKVGKILTQLFALMFGIGVAFYFGWTLTLVYMCLAPLTCLSGAIISHALKGGAIAQMKAYS